MLHKRRFFNEPCPLCRAFVWAPGPSHRQGARQEPEWYSGEQGDDPSYEVAKPPGPHPARIGWGDGDSFCVGGGVEMMR